MTNIEALHIGATWLIDGEVLDADGAPQDITGATVEWIVDIPQSGRRTFPATIEDAEAGQYRVRVSPAAQAGLTPGVYNYQMWLQLSDGTRTVPNAGSVTMLEGFKAWP